MVRRPRMGPGIGIVAIVGAWALVAGALAWLGLPATLVLAAALAALAVAPPWRGRWPARRPVPCVWRLETLVRYATAANGVRVGLPDGRWVPARPAAAPTVGERLAACWLVWTGRGDVVTWPGQEGRRRG